jgi:hypothetical protein
VQIYAEGAPGLQAPGEDEPALAPRDEEDYDAVFNAPSKAQATATAALLAAVPAAAADLEWAPATQLLQLPLTGLARKVLQRLGVMQLPKLQIGSRPSPSS